jgi:hypothetical protein
MATGAASGSTRTFAGVAGGVDCLPAGRNLGLELLSFGWCFIHIWPHAEFNP